MEGFILKLYNIQVQFYRLQYHNVFTNSFFSKLMHSITNIILNLCSISSAM